MERADVIVVSIYVNPTQFAANEDFGTYPRDTEGDMSKLRGLGVHAVFQPEGLYVDWRKNAEGAGVGVGAGEGAGGAGTGAG